LAKDISKNKVFQSPYKDEIEKRLALGSSPRSIASWLKTRGEDISYATINEYKKNFFSVDAEVGKIISEKQEETKAELIVDDTQAKLLETERNKHLSTIRAVNHIAVLYNNMHDMTEYLDKLKAYDPIVASHAARGIWQEIRSTIETLERLKEKEGSSDDSSVAKLLSSMKKAKKEMEKNE
jgi:hypothetical protein